MHELKGWAARRGVLLADVASGLDERRDVLVSWVHLNAEGNRLIARSLAATILAATCEETAVETAAR